jgi:hypothetical protein
MSENDNTSAGAATAEGTGDAAGSAPTETSGDAAASTATSEAANDASSDATSGATDEQPPAPTEEITYHAVEKDGQVTAIWEMQGRKHLRTIDPRSRQGQEILRLYTSEHAEEAQPQ